MKNLLIIFALTFSYYSFGQAPKVQGQASSSGVYSPNILVPNHSATKINGTTTLIETGNSNLLKNPSFEATIAGSDWNVEWKSGSSFCSLGGASSSYPQYGKQNLLAVCDGVGVVEVCQQVPTSSASMSASMYVQADQSLGKTELVTYSNAVQNFEVVSYPDDNSLFKKLITSDFLSGSSTTKICLRVTREAGMATSYIYADNAFLGLSNTVISNIKNESGWTTFTPTGSWTTNTNYFGKYRINGENLDIHYYLTFSGVPAPAVNLRLGMPSGFVMDESKMAGSWRYPSTGGEVGISSGTAYSVQANRATNTEWEILFQNSNNGSQGVVMPTTPIAINAGSTISILVSVPVTGLRSTVDMTSHASNPYDLKRGETFSFTVDGTLSPSTVSQTLPYITNAFCNRVVNGKWACPISWLKSRPNCVGSKDTATNQGTPVDYSLTESTNSSLVFVTHRAGTGDVNAKFTVTCTKTGEDLFDARAIATLTPIKESNIYYDRDEFHTDERDTGRKWEGKAIYKKCISSDTTITNGAVMATGTDALVRTSGYWARSGTRRLQVCGWNESAATVCPIADPTNNRVTLEVLGAASGRHRVCAEYTKL